jgi:hypothetical protein
VRNVGPCISDAFLWAPCGTGSSIRGSSVRARLGGPECNQGQLREWLALFSTAADIDRHDRSNSAPERGAGFAAGSGIFQRVTVLIEILQCLKKHGERLDSQIAEEVGLPLEAVRAHVAGLAATGGVITCNVTRYENGNPTVAWLYRISGYIPPAAPGRKAKPTKSV